MLTLALMMLLPGQIDTIESKEFSRELQATAILATVRLLNGAANSEGSGVIIRQKGPEVYVLTANHLIGKSERVEISIYSAKSYPRPEQVIQSAEVVARNRDADLALVRCTVRDLKTAPLRISPPGMTPGDNGFPVLLAGCGLGEAPTCRVDQVKEKRRVRKPDGAGPAWLWEVGDTPARGRSGGPLVDKRGHLLGICSGTSDGKGYYTHIDEIYAFLKRNGFQALYEDGKDP